MARYKRRIFDDRGPSLFDAAAELRFDDLGELPPPPDVRTVNVDDTARSAPGIEELQPGRDRDVMRFISFGSGSSGNSAYIGDDRGGVIIDAGIDAKTVAETLERNGIPMSRVKGICVTHDHGDHVRYLYAMLRRHKSIPLYCTPRALGGMLRRHSMSRRVQDYHHAIYREIPFKVGDMEITAFEVYHDGTDNVGYCIRLRNHTFVVATDLGTVTERALHYIQQADYLIIEANYDRTMLVNGSRPEYLKARILGDHGHLDNEATAALLRQIYTPKLRNIFLCHLSEDNNTPEIALELACRALIEAGAVSVGDGSESLVARKAPVQLVALPRFVPTPLYTLTHI